MIGRYCDVPIVAQDDYIVVVGADHGSTTMDTNFVKITFEISVQNCLEINKVC